MLDSGPAEFGPAPSDATVSPSLRRVPWTFSDLLIGFVPLLAATAAGSLIAPGTALSRWLWLPATLLDLGWLVGYPLWVARRRIGLPRLPTPRSVLCEGFLALAATPVVMIAATAVGRLLPYVFEKAPDMTAPFEGIAGSPDRLVPILLVVLAVAAAPIAEEFFFRGMVFNALRRRMHPIAAAILSGVVFALFHPFGNAERAVIAAVGVCLALLYEWRKTLLAPILLHAFVNGVSMAMLLWSMAAYANAPVLGIKGDAGDGGCRIVEVAPAGAAADAGLRPGDVIVVAAEYAVRDLRDVVLIMRLKRVGDKIPITYRRDGRSSTVEATLKARPK